MNREGLCSKGRDQGLEDWKWGGYRGCISVVSKGEGEGGREWHRGGS